MLDKEKLDKYIIFDEAFRGSLLAYLANCRLTRGKLEIDFNLDYSSIEIKLHTSERKGNQVITVTEKL